MLVPRPATDGETETVGQRSGFGGSSGLKTQTQWREASRRRQQTNTMALCQPPPPPPQQICSPQMVQGAKGGKGKDERERIIVVVRSPCQENPADAHTSAHKSVLKSANPRTDSECASGCPWSTARATAPSPGRPTPGVVKQDKSSGGSVDTTKTRSDPQRVGMHNGERPMGAANDNQANHTASCHPPPPPSTALSTAPRETPPPPLRGRCRRQRAARPRALSQGTVRDEGRAPGHVPIPQGIPDQTSPPPPPPRGQWAPPPTESHDYVLGGCILRLCSWSQMA